MKISNFNKFILLFILRVRISSEWYLRNSEEARSTWSSSKEGSNAFRDKFFDKRPSYFPRFSLYNLKDRVNLMVVTTTEATVKNENTTDSRKNSNETNWNKDLKHSNESDFGESVFSYSKTTNSIAKNKKVTENMKKLETSTYSISPEVSTFNWNNLKQEIEMNRKFPIILRNSRTGFVYTINKVDNFENSSLINSNLNFSSTAASLLKNNFEFISKEEHLKEIERIKKQFGENCASTNNTSREHLQIRTGHRRKKAKIKSSRVFPVDKLKKSEDLRNSTNHNKIRKGESSDHREESLKDKDSNRTGAFPVIVEYLKENKKSPFKILVINETNFPPSVLKKTVKKRSISMVNKTTVGDNGNKNFATILVKNHNTKGNSTAIILRKTPTKPTTIAKKTPTVTKLSQNRITTTAKPQTTSGHSQKRTMRPSVLTTHIYVTTGEYKNQNNHPFPALATEFPELTTPLSTSSVTTQKPCSNEDHKNIKRNDINDYGDYYFDFNFIPSFNDDEDDDLPGADSRGSDSVEDYQYDGEETTTNLIRNYNEYSDEAEGENYDEYDDDYNYENGLDGIRFRRRKDLIRRKHKQKLQNGNDKFFYGSKNNDSEGIIVRDERHGGFFDYFTDIFTPIGTAIRRFIANTADYAFSSDEENNGSSKDKNRKPKFPQKNKNNSATPNKKKNNNNSNKAKQGWLDYLFGSDEETTEGENDLQSDGSSWFDSWFETEKKVTTSSPNAFYYYTIDSGDKEEEIKNPENNDKGDNNSNWFFDWFNSKTKRHNFLPTFTSKITTTSTTTQIPILMISDPMKNPQNWIGILAQHIVNSTVSSTTATATISTTLPSAQDDQPRKMDYDKYQIWRLKPQTEGQVEALEDYKNSEDGVKLQWLKGPTLRGTTDVLIPPKFINGFEVTLNFEDIEHDVLIFDLGKAIQFEGTRSIFHHSSKSSSNPKEIFRFSWNMYHRYDDIIKYIELLQARNPTLIQIKHIGRSFEGKPLVIVKIINGRDSNMPPKIKFKKKTQRGRGVFIEAGSHGREWIGPASATWMINELVKIMKSNDTKTEFVRKTIWYIMPLSNPDGYEYTHEYDRMWRKSRSSYSPKRGLLDSAMTWFKNTKQEKVCYGVDLNRNWDFEWGRKGSSKSPCNEFFAGPGSLSEPETRALSKYLIENRKTIKLLISLHSYGQTISYPSKTNNPYDSEKLNDLLDIAMVGIDGLRKSGSSTRYKIDSVNDIVRYKSGSLDAFAMHTVGIPFTYTIYLGDNDIHGFLLPGTYIESTASDAFEIIKAMLDYI